MRRYLKFAAALGFVALTAVPSYAGPSRALIQEMGSTVAEKEINIDLDVVSQGINVVDANDTKLGDGNATLGGTTVSSVNVGLADNLELRAGRLPGLRSFLTLPAVGAVAFNPSPNNYGLTLKATVAPGLAVWGGYGMATAGNITSSDTTADGNGQSARVGVAYTWAGPVILNATIDYAYDTAKNAGAKFGDVNTIEGAVAALYPLKENILIGAELHYAHMDIGDDEAVAGNQEFTLDVLAPAIGARFISGKWTIDAVVAILGSSVELAGTPSLPASLDEKASLNVIGVPSLRVNYVF